MKTTTYYILKKDIEIEGKTIPKGKLVKVTFLPRQNVEVSTFNGKTKVTMSFAKFSVEYGKTCKLTINSKQKFFVELNTDYHQYYAMGTDLYAIGKKIMEMYGTYAEKTPTMYSFARDEECGDYNMRVYILKDEFDSIIAFDDEYNSIGESPENDTIGDLLSLYRKSTLWGKDFFNNSMR